MVDHRTRPQQPRGLLLVLLAACLVAALPLVLYRSAAATSKEQAQVRPQLLAGLGCCEQFCEDGKARCLLGAVLAGLQECITPQSLSAVGWAPWPVLASGRQLGEWHGSLIRNLA